MNAAGWLLMTVNSRSRSKRVPSWVPRGMTQTARLRQSLPAPALDADVVGRARCRPGSAAASTPAGSWRSRRRTPRRSRPRPRAARSRARTGRAPNQAVQRVEHLVARDAGVKKPPLNRTASGRTIAAAPVRRAAPCQEAGEMPGDRRLGLVRQTELAQADAAIARRQIVRRGERQEALRAAPHDVVARQLGGHARRRRRRGRCRGA